MYINIYIHICIYTPLYMYTYIHISFACIHICVPDINTRRRTHRRPLSKLGSRVLSFIKITPRLNNKTL